MAIRFFVFLLFFLTCSYSASATDRHDKAGTKTESVNVSMRFTDFNLIFRNNPDLKQEDLRVLPHGLQHYLLIQSDWQDKEIQASSDELSRGRFLVSIKYPSNHGYQSKAALLIRHGKTVSPSKGFTWKPLVLPKLEKWGEGWAISASDSHFDLMWLADQKSVQTTYCGDLVDKPCIRHTVKLFRDRQVLVSVEVDTSRRGENWQIFWEKGNWLPELPSAEGH